MLVLRPYQVDGIRHIREAFAAGFKAPLYVLPTGAGKTVSFSEIAHSADKRGKRVLILAHRAELIDQIVTALRATDVSPDIICAGYQRMVRRRNATVSVASVQTLVRRLDTYVEPTLIIIDEAHHVSGTASAGNTWAKIIAAYPNAKRLGVTATPIRLDGRGLARHFDKMILGPSVSELTRDGYLSPARIFAPPTVDTSGLHIRAGDFATNEAEALVDTNTITGDALSHYRKYSDGKAALAFCVSVAHAHHVADQFRAGGVNAVALDGGTDKEIRRRVVADFRDGKIQVMTSCDLFSEGLDTPAVHTGIMLRPTASTGLFLQQVGRILRVFPGKSHAVILDHVGNTRRHGLPTDERDWQLTDDAERRKKKPAISIRICASCFAACAVGTRTCPNCGAEIVTKERQELTEKEGELIELTAEQIQAKQRRREQGRSRTLEELERFARIRGYSDQWARHVWEARQKKQKATA